MNVTLIRHTLSPEELVALGARLCYSKSTLTDLKERVSGCDQKDYVSRIIDMGHESVLEHASFTFGIEGVSRVLLAQITRHRLASFSVQSQRYCGAAPEWVVPPKIAELGLQYDYLNFCNAAYEKFCDYLVRGVPEEDARFVLPQGVTCRMMVTMNVRELRHFFSLRCCTRAQWEIRALANEMLRLCKQVAPMLFADAGPGCVRGRCPEGEKSCGKGRKA